MRNATNDPFGLKGDPPALTEFPGVVPTGGEGHVFVAAPGWPVHVVAGAPPGPQLFPLGVAREDSVPKSDSMATTIAEAITAIRIFCIDVTSTSFYIKWIHESHFWYSA